MTQLTPELLIQLVSRIERLEEEKANILEDIKQVYAEVKGNGFDVKVVKKIVADRKKDAGDLAEEIALYEIYDNALKGGE